jgi:hypothetical protein
LRVAPLSAPYHALLDLYEAASAPSPGDGFDCGNPVPGYALRTRQSFRCAP